MNKKGNIEWTKAVRGDSAYVKSEKKMGIILKDYGRKFHLKFSDDSEKTYDANELDFYRFDEDEYGDGGNVNTWHKGDITVVNGEYRNKAEVVPTYKDDRMTGKYFVVFRGSNDKIISSKDNFETYDSALKYAKENVNNSKQFKDGGNIEKENNDMLQGQIKEAAHHTKELGYIVKDKTVIEPWVVAKMERATTDLSDVTHYLDGQEDKRLSKPVYATGGNVFTNKPDDFLYSNIAEKWEELQQIRSDIKTFILLAQQVSGEELSYDIANAIVLGMIDASKTIKETEGSEFANDVASMFNRAEWDLKN